MGKVFAITNQKGGVGKTTTTRNLGSALAGLGRKVMLIDLDPQGHLTLSFGLNPLDFKKHIYHVLIDDDVSIASVLAYQQDSGIGLVPANIDLAGAEVELMIDPHSNRNLALKEKIEPIIDKVDYILIDCPPSLGILTINALTAADGAIIPVQTQYLAYHGLHLLLNTITKTQRRNPKLKIAGIIPTLYDMRARHDNEVLGELRQHYRDVLIDLPVPRRTNMADAMVAGESIDTFDSGSKMDKLFQQIAEVIDRG